MATDEPGGIARKQLSTIERRRQIAVLSEFKKIETRLMSAVADLLERIERERNTEGNASETLLFERGRLDQLLSAVTAEIEKISKRLGVAVAGSQNAAIKIAADQAAKYPQISNSLIGLDVEATAELIGIAGNGRPLDRHFARLAEPLRLAMFDALFYGIASGRANAGIAAEVRDAIGGTAAAAMTIVRTETNRAYREASRQFYAGADAVTGWRWLAALDLRTCVICWAMHGRVFKTKTKFGTHPNCRCVMVPVFADDEPVPTGPELFAALNDAQRRTILGPKRLDLYLQGAELSDFVETNKSAFGIGRNVRPLRRTTFKPNPRDPNPPTPPRPIGPRVPVQLPAIPEPLDPLPIPAAVVGPFDAAAIRAKFLKDAAAFEVPDKLAELRATFKEKANNFWTVSAKFWKKEATEAEKLFAEIERDAARTAINEHIDELAAAAARQRKLLYAPNPTAIVPDLKSAKGSFPRTKPKRRELVLGVVDELNKLIDAAGWPNRKDITFRFSKGRAKYWNRNVYINADDPREAKTIAHEVAHGLEMLNPDNLKAANEFLDYRTPGETPIRLSKLLPGHGYRSDEVARPDKFASPYVGKRYGPVGNQDATEVVSMGVEYLFDNPTKFARDDPEYFDFILHIIRGVKWLKPK